MTTTRQSEIALEAPPTIQPSLQDARFNLREIIKQLILVEDHLFHANKQCSDCIHKHLLMVEALAEEAMTLDGGLLDPKYPMIATVAASWLNAYNAGTATPMELAQEIRQIRKQLVQQIKTAQLLYTTPKYLQNLIKTVRFNDRPGMPFYGQWGRTEAYLLKLIEHEPLDPDTLFRILSKTLDPQQVNLLRQVSIPRPAVVRVFSLEKALESLSREVPGVNIKTKNLSNSYSERVTTFAKAFMLIRAKYKTAWEILTHELKVISLDPTAKATRFNDTRELILSCKTEQPLMEVVLDLLSAISYLYWGDEILSKGELLKLVVNTPVSELRL